MSYETPAALRQAIEERIRSRKREGADPMRLRQSLVFERVLARLVRSARSTWVVKGGVALQLREPHRARATKDLDLAVSGVELAEIEDLVSEAFAEDPDGDSFVITLTEIRPLPPVEAGRHGWRLRIRVDLDGREFASIHVDVVTLTTEDGLTDRHHFPSALGFAGIPDVEVALVDLDHHFAEKLAAYMTERPDRENTRVKDLTDLVLLVETGLEPTPRLRDVVKLVFAAREQDPPAALPTPPSAWSATYADQAASCRLTAITLDDAYRVVSEFWFASTQEIL